MSTAPSSFLRRKGAVVAVAAVAALTLAACGSSTSDGGDAASQPVSEQGQSADAGNSAGADNAGTEDDADARSGDAAAESQELVVWHYFSADNQVKLMDDYAQKFEDAHPGVTVTNVFQPYDQLNSKVITATGAGQGPDVIVFNGAEWSALGLADALLPLDDYWANYADADQFPDGVQHGTEDHLYALQGYVNLLGLWYNADILDELGLQPPTTMDEMESAMAAAKDAGYDGITLSALPQSQGEWQAYPWLTNEGFSYEDPNEEALAGAFDRVRTWVEKGYLSQEAVTWDQTVPFQEFTAGNVLFAENGNWQISAAEADASFEFGVVPLPLSDTGKVYLGGEGEAIGANSTNPDLAWEYLAETYLDPDGQLMAVAEVGSIPSRLDAASDSSVTSNELLAPFSETLAQRGANYPSGVIPLKDVADVQTTVGQAWSAAVGGQQSPSDAAANVIGSLQFN